MCLLIIIVMECEKSMRNHYYEHYSNAHTINH